MIHGAGENSTVMVVDDSKDIRELISMRLRWKGYQVVEAETGEEAVNLAPQTHPGLILMDLSMPGMDGYEATRLIKAMPGFDGIPIVAVSAFCQSGNKDKALEAGCIECVTKPIDFGTFDSMLSRHLQVH
jgi:two-component system, cell cycle response regulator DivK